MRNQEDIFYAAMIARDYRFDGKFFVGVKTTGIYCRPICPAKPKRENIEFFSNAFDAEKAGYRPCLRCRPECAPLSPAWIGKSAIVQRALKVIASNDSFESNENCFAEQFGVSARHLRRLFEEEVGKTPKQIFDVHRLNFARKLILETNLLITDIAFTSGFSSLRRFNDAIKKRFHRSPSELRKGSKETANEVGIKISLSYRPPFDWSSLLDFYQSHQIFSIETVTSKSYSRVFQIEKSIGAFSLEQNSKKPELILQLVVDDIKCLHRVVQNVRQMFDLDSDPLLISNAFSSNELMSKFLEKHPGLRIPGGWDPFETVICCILGQLVSIEQASRLVKQLVSCYGKEITNPITKKSSFLFPSPEILATQSLSQLGTTKARIETIREFSRQVLQKEIQLTSTQDLIGFKKSLLQIKGIGQWTAEYVSLRALGNTDAFPGSDLVLKRALELHPEISLETLKPWQAYAAIYIWKEFAGKLSKKKEKK